MWDEAEPDADPAEDEQQPEGDAAGAHAGAPDGRDPEPSHTGYHYNSDTSDDEPW